jgi:hypothetical protein
MKEHRPWRENCSRLHEAVMQGAAEFRLVSSTERSIQSIALVVDLDGTLVKTDLLLESVLALLKRRPLYLFILPVWLLKGRAYLKQQIARRVLLDVRVLPYRDDLLDYLKTLHSEGRTIALATAGDIQTARQVADHVKLFDLILASDGTANLSGESKRARLVREFGEKGFDYAGNDRRDLVVWSSAEGDSGEPDLAGEFTHCKSSPSRPRLRKSKKRIRGPSGATSSPALAEEHPAVCATHCGPSLL